jgi:hypothetical protein
VGLLLLLRPEPHQELAFYPFSCRFLSPPDQRRRAVRVTRWNPLCDRTKEKRKAQRENKKKKQ